MKMVIASSFGGNLPDVVVKNMNKDTKYPQCRMGKITEWIEKRADKYSDIFFGEVGDGSLLNEYLSDNPDALVKIGENKYVGWCSTIHHCVSFTLREVDISKPWTIREYDGCESICSIPQYKCIDEDLNLYEEVAEERDY